MKTSAKKKTAAIIICALTLISQLSPSLCASYWKGDVLVSRDIGKKRIALTFDDGPHPTLTPEILDILDAYGIRATFFVVGDNAEKHSDIIVREVSEGHELGNHTYSHRVLMNLDSKSISAEIGEVEDKLYEICEYRTKVLRPPGGLYRENLCRYAEENDYTVVLWSIDTRDWAHRPAADICRDVLETVSSGDIILCHDFIGESSPTPELLNLMLPKLLERGYEFVTVSELENSNG